MSELRSHTDVLRDSQSRRISFWKRTGTKRVLPANASDADYIAHLKARCTFTESGCWECAGFQYQSQGMKRVSKGYVDFSYRRRRIKAHRISYILHFGPIPDRMEVCHTCDNPPCCNPDHLFLGTGSQNALDRVAKNRDRNRGRTHCIRGHELTGDNLRIRPTLRGFRRQCITCEGIHQKSERYKAWRRQWQNKRRAAKRNKTDDPAECHMSVCEKCWSDAGGQMERYVELLAERASNPCTPEQQKGEPEVCERCHGTGLVTISYGGDGYGDRCAALADADDQPCPECTP